MPEKTITRIGGWTRHNCKDEAPKGLTGTIEVAWFDPREDDEYRVGFTIMAAGRDPNNISPAWDHVFAYRKVENTA